jgi:serine/threonine-protein kinase
MSFIKRLLSRLRRKWAGSDGPGTPAQTAKPVSPEPDDATMPIENLIGRPDQATPLVIVPMGNATVITDRLTYEYQNGLTPGSEPSQAELDLVMTRVTRLRILAGGMMREAAIGTDVLLDTRDRGKIATFVRALAINESRETWGHCACLGSPTVECYASRERIATLSFHHGRGFRWDRWKHDVQLLAPEMLRDWFDQNGIDSEATDKGEDPMQLHLLSLKESDRLAYRAQSHLVRNEAHLAMEDCTRALAVDSECAVAYGVRALIHRAGQRSSECEADCDQAIRRGLDHPEVYFARAMARLATGNADGAAADCDAALALAPEHPGVHNTLGLIRVQKGDTDGARRDFSKASTLAPGWPLPLANRANLLAQTGETELAIADLTRGIEIIEEAAANDPAAASSLGGYPLSAYHAMRGRMRQARDEFEAASDDFDKAVELDPDDPRAWLARGQFHAETGQLESALEDFSEAIDSRPDLVDGYLNRAQLRALLQEFDEALDDLSEAIRWSPDNPLPLLQRGQLLLFLERHADARHDFDALIELGPEQALGYHMRSYCWGKANEYERKREDLELAVKFAPEWSDPCNSLAWLLATCPDPALRDGERAVEIGRRALKCASEQTKPACLDTLAAALAEAGNFAEAIDLELEAIALMEDPDRRMRYEYRLALYEDGEAYHEENPHD